MSLTKVHPLDLEFLQKKDAIAAYLVKHATGAALVETGPGSTVAALVERLAGHGLSPKDITHVFITHIHLDHAGAAGWMAGQGAQVHVHPVGAPHLLNPEKLLSSAARLYGDRMDFLWGKFLPVPPENLVAVEDGQVIRAGGLAFTAIHTPGHAEHHVSWLLEDTCFTGDIGGVKIPGPRYIRMPFVPPELHIGKWRQSLQRLQSARFRHIAPTHYSVYPDATEHLALAGRILDETEAWVSEVMPSDPPVEKLREMFVAMLYEQALRLGLDEETITRYEIANPTWMGADGLQRYWRKVVMAA